MPAETIERILECAIKLFARKGIATVTINDIAERAGVAAGTVIYHFKTKNNLLFVAARTIFYRLLESAEVAVRNSAQSDEKIQRFIESFFGCVDGSRDDIIFLSRLDPFISLDLSTFPNADLVFVKDRYINLMTNCLKEGVSSGKFREVECGQFATMIWAFLRGVAVLAGEGADIRCLRSQILETIEARLVR